MNQNFNVKYPDVTNFKAWSKVNFKMKLLSERCYRKTTHKKNKVTFQVSNFFAFIFDPKKPGEVLCCKEMSNELFNVKIITYFDVTDLIKSRHVFDEGGGVDRPPKPM